ncbi:leucine zipper domain-containing protein [Streptomyces sp. NPDC006173]|uniref:helix-turn-helix domain-containing protein n=1 Tax=Streptomyces sp. NPDC006173 TaxID=3155349 RepID=UPI0033F4F631
MDGPRQRPSTPRPASCRVDADVQQLAECATGAVREVLGRSPIVEAPARYGTSRQTLHNWRRRIEQEGMPGLLDRSRRPRSVPRVCPPRWRPRSASCVTVVIEDTHYRILHGEDELAVRPRKNLEPITRLYVKGMGARKGRQGSPDDKPSRKSRHRTPTTNDNAFLPARSNPPNNRSVPTAGPEGSSRRFPTGRRPVLLS